MVQSRTDTAQKLALTAAQMLRVYYYYYYYRAVLYASRSFWSQRCPSVCLSVTRVNCDKTNESSVDIRIPHERKIHLFFRTHRIVGGGRPFYLKLWVKLTHLASKTAIDIRHLIFARTALAFSPSEKVQLWLIQSRYELSNEPKMNSLRCP